MSKSLCLMLCVSLVINSIAVAAEPSADFSVPQRLDRFACGSCSKQSDPQPIWQAIVDDAPQLFIYMGDNIYGDTDDMQVLKAKWDQQKKVPGYQKLRENCTVIATWDDHDYGKNDAGREYPQKAASQQLFLDFLDEPADSLRRTRDGVYASYLYGPVGQRVQIILLDTRYFRSPLKKGPNKFSEAVGIGGPYVPTDDQSADMLGPAQWSWLKQQLQVPAEIRFLVSSIQVLPLEHRYEKWQNMPAERQKLLDVIKDTQANHVILLSGDRHAAELSMLPRDSDYPLWELTTSSLNRPILRFGNELNRLRFGLKYYSENYGLIEIDWSQSDPIITLTVCGLDGTPVLSVPLLQSTMEPTFGLTP